jgi:hypothetical protein
LTVCCTANYVQARVIESLMQAIRGGAFAIPGALGVQEGGLVANANLRFCQSRLLSMSLIKRVPDFVFGAPSLLGWQALEDRALLARDVSVQGQGK